MEEREHGLGASEAVAGIDGTATALPYCAHGRG
jgi:hypothetical protein